MDLGIRRLSEICFGLGMFLLIFVGLLEQPVYLLNLFCQSVGYYLNWLLQLGTHCDAFEMHSRSMMGTDRGRIVDSGTDGPKRWMDDWTIFYWGWWIAWSPFVGQYPSLPSRTSQNTISTSISGIFIAKISKGRTIREFINGTLTAPILYSFFWMAVFGGAGIGMERKAAIMGYSCSGMPRAADKSYVRLSCYSSDEMWFYLMESHGDVGHFLDVVSLAAIILYFVTSSDSGSYIIDTLGSNGDLDPPRLQRLFWSLTEGGAATALVMAGGEDGLTALRTVSIVTGLPFTVVICFVCVALWRSCAVAFKDLDASAPDFEIGYLDFASEFKARIILDWLLGWILGPFWAARAACKAWDYKNFMVPIMSVITYLFLLMFVVFYIASIEITQFWALAWTWYITFATLMGAYRTAVRSKMGYLGNPVEDFFAGLFLYPSVGQQLKDYGGEGSGRVTAVEQKGKANGVV